MMDLVEILRASCSDCWGWTKCFSIYGVIAVALTFLYDRKIITAKMASIRVPSDFSLSPFSFVDVKTLLFIRLSVVLTPQTYVDSLSKFAEMLGRITKISTSSFPVSCFRMFLFYYIIASAPAAVMVPRNYPTTIYDYDSLIALLLMMATNAIGDVLSIKITLKNIERISSFHEKFVTKEDTASLSTMIKTEMVLYGWTIIDMLIALGVLFGVIILTSVYFGASVGEYDFELSYNFLLNAWHRVSIFWQTISEPYGFRSEMVAIDGSAPMLLIYSVTSFIPTLLILLAAIIWSIALPVRIIILSEYTKPIKLIFAQSVIGLLCMTGSFIQSTFWPSAVGYIKTYFS